jgi:predicted N-acetyltransferase YhbS
MEIIEFGQLTHEARAELDGNEEDPFDAVGATLVYQGKDRHVGLRDDAGRLVASTGMLVVDVEVQDQCFPVVGVGGVIVNAHHRGRGLARQVVQAPLTRAQGLGPAFALPFCHEDRAGLYRKLGFLDIVSAVVVKEPDGYKAMADRTMWHSLRPDATWPSGEVTVYGLPF